MAKNQHATKEKSLKKSYVWVMTVCQKLGVILQSKVVQKLSLEKNAFDKKCSPVWIFLDEIFFWKNSVDFWH